MKVLKGRVEQPDTKAMELEEQEHYRFRELMIRNKDKRLYRSMMKNRKGREREAKRLDMKRKLHDKEVKTTDKNPAEKWSIKKNKADSADPPIKKKKASTWIYVIVNIFSW